MTALEKIFEGWHERRLDGETDEPEAVTAAYNDVEKELEEQKVEDICAVMETVSLYGCEAERDGFYAVFRMAWELLRDMQGM